VAAKLLFADVRLDGVIVPHFRHALALNHNLCLHTKNSICPFSIIIRYWLPCAATLASVLHDDHEYNS